MNQRNSNMYFSHFPQLMLMAVLNCLFESLNQILRFVHMNHTVHFKATVVSKTPKFLVHPKELFVFMKNSYN